jgi:hypothetical protein
LILMQPLFIFTVACRSRESDGRPTGPRFKVTGRGIVDPRFHGDDRGIFGAVLTSLAP